MIVEISHQLYRCLFYTPDNKMFAFSRLPQLLFELISNSPNKVDRQIRSLIFSYIANKKIAKSSMKQLLNAAISPVFNEKWH